MYYKFSQVFDSDGFPRDFYLEVSFQDNVDSADLDCSELSDLVKVRSQNIEIIRESILTNNLTTSANYEMLQRQFEQSRYDLKVILKALSDARKHYEILQAFFKAQGIEDISDFLNLNISQLQGELLEKKQS